MVIDWDKSYEYRLILQFVKKIILYVFMGE